MITAVRLPGGTTGGVVMPGSDRIRSGVGGERHGWSGAATRRRVLRALALAAVLLAVLAAAASADVVYNRADDCINPSPVGASVIGTTADGSLQVLAEPADRRLATNLLSGLQSGPLAGLHSAFSADGGSGRLPAGPDGGPYQLMVAPASDFDADNDGDTAGYCDGSAISAIAMRDNVSDPLTVATHELGHAFDDGLLGQQSFDTWFEEALSEYYAFVLAPDATLQRNRDDQLFSQPTIPLDTFSSPSDDEQAHEYTEDRFLQWLAQRLGPRFDAMAMSVLRDSGTTSTTALHVNRDLSDALTLSGRSFADDLGEFWGDHIIPESDQPFGGTGPRTHPQPRIFTHDEELSTDVHLRSLAANSATIKLGDDVKQLVLHISSPEPHGRLWVWSPDGGLEDMSHSGGDLHFCVGPVSSDAIEWPGELRFVLINTGATGAAFPVQVKALTDKCTRPRRRPPPPPSHGCHTPTPRLGFYSNAGPEAQIVVNPTLDIYLMCQAGHRYVGSISGESTCDGTLFGAGIDLGQPGAWVEHSYRGPGELHGTRFAFSYSANGARIQLAGNFAASSVTGTVDYQSPAACDGAPLAQSFSLTRKSGLPFSRAHVR
jgi:hypothetical protein